MRPTQGVGKLTLRKNGEPNEKKYEDKKQKARQVSRSPKV
jgi:hypothetical protein